MEKEADLIIKDNGIGGHIHWVANRNFTLAAHQIIPFIAQYLIKSTWIKCERSNGFAFFWIIMTLDNLSGPLEASLWAIWLTPFN